MQRLFMIGMLIMVIVLSGCDNKPSASTAQQNLVPEQPTVPNEFNTSDKSIESNGNILVAFSKYKQMVDTGPIAEFMHASEITKSPYSNLGKMVMVKGRVYKVEELPPDPRLPGRMHEILILTNNSNSALGATTIDCLCIGDVSKVNSDQIATCGGYFVGTYDSPNAMGGTVEALTIVGNIVKK